MVQDLKKYFRLSPFFAGSASMSDLAWDRLQDKIDFLPPSLQNLLTSSRTSDFVENLAQKYIQLSVQGPDVARLIRDVVTADVFIGDMPQELSSRLGVDPTLAREVANQIVSQLFAPVLEELKQAHRVKFPGKVGPRPPTAGSQSNSARQRPDQPPPPHLQPPASRFQPPATGRYQGEELPESGGNIIDLRNRF